LDIAFQGIKFAGTQLHQEEEKTKNLGSKIHTFLLHLVVSRNTKSGFHRINTLLLHPPKCTIGN
jgi:hypothetical protein